jgi:uncharacterized Zn finger protein (UPF0148 family)
MDPSIESVNRPSSDAVTPTASVMSRGSELGHMKIRGERECTDCGTRWSYYESGSVVCPSCGAIRSVGVDSAREHTAETESLDLTAVRGLVDDAPLEEIADETESLCRSYVRRAGFIRAGALEPLDDTFLAAAELRHVAADVGRGLAVPDDEEYYFLSLLRGADDGERPPPAEVPESLRAARGLGYADAIDAYRGDLRLHLENNPDPVARRVLGSVRDHVKQIEALDGDVGPESAETLVRAARDVGRALSTDDESALADAQTRLDGFELDV